MASQLTHSELQELLGAYALDAVEPDEAAAIETHLTECPRCRAEVAEHREAATLLAFAGSPAPDALWDRVAGALDEPPPPLGLAPVVPMRPRRAGPTRALVAAVAVAAAVIAALGVEVVRQDHRIDRLAAVTDQRGLEQAAAAAAVAPGARTVRLRSGDGRQTADAIVLPDGRGYLVQARLPAVAAGHTYQLWGIVAGQPISLGLLGGDPAISSFRAVGPLSALAITAEAEGGAAAPTVAPIVQGALTVD